jgi:peptide/nickel transport system permease protein/oligopeptide transport system permease protein
MTRYVLSRLLQAIPTVLLITVIVFLLLQLIPGDPAEIFLGDSASTPELLARIREQMGLNRPVGEQYVSFLFNAARGDFGTSLNNGRPVLGEILLRLPNTLELTLFAMTVATILGIGLGVLAALNHNTIIDTGAMLLALLGISMPVFWSGLLLIIVFSVNLRWFPPIGEGSFDRVVLPGVALGLLSAASLARLVRSSMLEVMSQEFITTARSKGLRRRRIIWGHAFRNTLIPVVTTLGLMFGQLLGGSVIVETIFSRLGVGRLYVDGILNKDYTLVQGMSLFIALAYVMINLVVDILYAYIDPRIRYQ